jgi:hypothetical protein
VAALTGGGDGSLLAFELFNPLSALGMRGRRPAQLRPLFTGALARDGAIPRTRTVHLLNTSWTHSEKIVAPVQHVRRRWTRAAATRAMKGHAPTGPHSMAMGRDRDLGRHGAGRQPSTDHRSRFNPFTRDQRLEEGAHARARWVAVAAFFDRPCVRKSGTSCSISRLETDGHGRPRTRSLVRAIMSSRCTAIPSYNIIPLLAVINGRSSPIRGTQMWVAEGQTRDGP